jgi:hypothetical protein
MSILMAPCIFARTDWKARSPISSKSQETMGRRRLPGKGITLENTRRKMSEQNTGTDNDPRGKKCQGVHIKFLGEMIVRASWANHKSSTFAAFVQLKQPSPISETRTEGWPKVSRPKPAPNA